MSRPITRPALDREPLVAIGLSLPESEAIRLRQVAAAADQSVAEFVRAWLRRTILTSATSDALAESI
jgi:hypothetical protein